VLVQQAQDRLPRVRGLRDEATVLRAEARERLDAIPLWAPEVERHGAWALEERAEELEIEAGLEDLAAEQGVRAALSLAPDLSDAHAALAERYQAEHRAAEAAGDRAGAARAEALLTAHVVALPEAHRVRAEATAWLSGEGLLTLHTDPAGAEVFAERTVRRNRLWVTEPAGSLGTTPLDRVVLPAGTWTLRVRAPGRPEVVVPVQIERTGHWDGVPPGADTTRPIPLPPVVPDGFVYVPPGWFLCGEVDEENALGRARLWCDGFFVGRFPVTVAEFCTFLEHRLAQGVDIEPWILRNPIGRYGNEGPPLLELGDDGRVRPLADDDGDQLTPDMPAICADWASAVAYAVWLAEVTGEPWRLLGELEWEKAGRGVDGRPFPWGEQADASRCNTRDSTPGRPLPAPVDTFPLDCSPYGVRGCAGNVRDWTADLHHDDGPPLDGLRVVPPPLVPTLPEGATVAGRGGGWPSRYQGSGLTRINDRPTYRHPGVAFRVGRSWPD
jgi:serine/threonine-protein kinase